MVAPRAATRPEPRAMIAEGSHHNRRGQAGRDAAPSADAVLVATPYTATWRHIQSTLFRHIFPEFVPQLPSGSPTTPIHIPRMFHECVSIAVCRAVAIVRSDFHFNDARLDICMDSNEFAEIDLQSETVESISRSGTVVVCPCRAWHRSLWWE